MANAEGLLTSVLAEMERRYEELVDKFVAADAEVDRLRALLRKMVEAVDELGLAEHANECAIRNTTEIECDCGMAELNAALASVEDVLKEEA